MENITFTSDNVVKFVKVAKAYMNVAKRCNVNNFDSGVRFAVMVSKSYGVKTLVLLMQTSAGSAPESVVWCTEREEGDGKSFYYLLGAEAFVKALAHCNGVVEFTSECEPLGGYASKATVYSNGSVVNLSREGVSNTYVKECPAEFYELPLCPSAELFFEGSDFAKAISVASRNLAPTAYTDTSGVNVVFDAERNVLKVRATDRFKISQDEVALHEGSFSAFKDTLNMTSANHELMGRAVKAMGMRGDSRLEVGVDNYQRKFMIIRNGLLAIRVNTLQGCVFPDNANVDYFTERSRLSASVHVGLREFEKVVKDAPTFEGNGIKITQLAFRGSALVVGSAEGYTTMSVLEGEGQCLCFANFDLLLNAISQARVRANKNSQLVIEAFTKHSLPENDATYYKISLDNVEGSTLVVAVRPTDEVKRLDAILDAIPVEVQVAEPVEVVDAEPVAESETETQDVTPAQDAEPVENVQDAEPETPTVELAKPTQVESKPAPAKPVERVEPVKPHAITVTAPAGVPAKEIPELAGMGRAKAFRDLKGRKLAYVASDGKRCVVVWRDWYKRDDKELVSRVENYVTSLGFVA